MKNRLKEIRTKKGLSLEQVGKGVGLATNTISRYETGKREPKLDTWLKLADFFGFSVPYLQGAPAYSRKYIYGLLNNSCFLNDSLGDAIEDYLETAHIKKPEDKFESPNDIKNFIPAVEKYWEKHFSFVFEEDSFVRTAVVHELCIDDFQDEQIKKTLISIIDNQRLKISNTPLSEMMEKNISFDFSKALIMNSRYASKEDILRVISLIQNSLNDITQKINQLPDNPKPTGIYKKYDKYFKDWLKEKEKNL